MLPEIENILGIDEATREKLDAAAGEAERIRSRAQQDARETLAAKRGELSSAVAAEHENVLAEARSKAARITEDTDRYIEGLQEKQRAILNQLVDNLLKKVTEI
jgi:vacuolar-type H+-ATPase subunit H